LVPTYGPTIIGQSSVPTAAPFNSAVCAAVVVLDFERSGNTSLVEGGSYVSDEWKSSHGVSISAISTCGGYTPDNKARIFNSSRPFGEDDDLGSPNA
jgi:hypothetical protein